MNDEYSELNDIILNRHKKSGTRKKMLIGIGLLAIVAIVIVVIMGRMSGSAPTPLAQTLPPAAKPVQQQTAPAPITPAPSKPEPVPAAEQNVPAEAPKAAVAQTPVSPAQSGVTVIDETQPAAEAPKPAPVKPAPVQPAPVQPAAKPAPVSPPVATKTVTPPKPKPVAKSTIYIQVGSFTRYKPSRTFLATIKRNGYDYTYHRVVLSGKIVNKVLVGPFKDRSDAVAHLADVRRKIEPGAFIYTKK